MGIVEMTLGYDEIDHTCSMMTKSTSGVEYEWNELTTLIPTRCIILALLLILTYAYAIRIVPVLSRVPTGNRNINVYGADVGVDGEVRDRTLSFPITNSWFDPNNKTSTTSETSESMNDEVMPLSNTNTTVRNARMSMGEFGRQLAFRAYVRKRSAVA
jgi:hypothetical protein